MGPKPKVTIVTLLVITIGFGLYTLYQGRLVPYVPCSLEFQKGDPVFVSQPSLLTPEHIVALTNILAVAGVPFEMRNRVLFIPGALARDKEVLHKYTEQALP